MNDSFMKYIEKKNAFGESLHHPIILKNQKYHTSDINVYIKIHKEFFPYNTTYVTKRNGKYIMLVNEEPITCVEDMSQLANVLGKTGHFGVIVEKINSNNVKELSETFDKIKEQKNYFLLQLEDFREQSQTHVHPELSNVLRMIMDVSSIKQKRMSILKNK